MGGGALGPRPIGCGDKHCEVPSPVFNEHMASTNLKRGAILFGIPLTFVLADGAFETFIPGCNSALGATEGCNALGLNLNGLVGMLFVLEGISLLLLPLAILFLCIGLFQFAASLLKRKS